MLFICQKALKFQVFESLQKGLELWKRSAISNLLPIFNYSNTITSRDIESKDKDKCESNFIQIKLKCILV